MQVKLRKTRWDGRIVREEEVFDTHRDAEREARLMWLYPDRTYQTVTGFGGAATEAAAYVFFSLPESAREEFLDKYFGPEGLGYTHLRVSIDSCDFSLSQYEAMSDPEDRALASFSMARDEKYVLPFLRILQERSGKPLRLLFSPWSPPAFMKTNHDRLLGGKLRKECYAFWADYVSRYIREYEERGFTVDMMTVQNEPRATQVWDSCLYTAQEEAELLRDHLYPTLKRNAQDHVKLLVWDHNKDRAYERVDAIMRENVDGMVSGAACHWYSGDHFENLAMIREKYPDLLLCLSEFCVGRAYFPERFEQHKAEQYLHELIGDLNAGLNMFFDWNLLLDEEGGPNHVENFTGAPAVKEGDHLVWRMTYDALAHVTRYVRPGAVRIALSRYCGDVEACAFRNVDGSYAVVMLNMTERACPFALRLGDEMGDMVLEPHTMATAVLTP